MIAFQINGSERRERGCAALGFLFLGIGIVLQALYLSLT
jgi:hypothetical protein